MNTLSPGQLAELERRLMERGYKHAKSHWQDVTSIGSPESELVYMMDVPNSIPTDQYTVLITAYRSGFESFWREHLGLPEGPSSTSESHALPAVPDVPPVEPLGTEEFSTVRKFRDTEGQIGFISSYPDRFVIEAVDCGPLSLSKPQVRSLAAHLTQWAENNTLKLPN